MLQWEPSNQWHLLRVAASRGSYYRYVGITQWTTSTNGFRYNDTIGSDNSFWPAIIWTNTGILLIGPILTNFCEILSKIHTFLFMKINLKKSSAKWRPFCLGLDVLMFWALSIMHCYALNTLCAQLFTWSSQSCNKQYHVPHQKVQSMHSYSHHMTQYIYQM